MNVVLIGASGMIGSRVLVELLARGHQVRAFVRHPERVAAAKNLTVVAGDQGDAEAVAAATRGADAVVSAYSPGFGTGDPFALVEATRSLIRGLESSGVKRLIMVGGAGSLLVAPGLQLVDAPNFPADYKPIALAHRDALDLLKGSKLDWTSFSPAAVIAPGERTGRFRLDTESLVADAKGESHISAEDYAIALVDELEQGKHVRQRFTIGY